MSLAEWVVAAARRPAFITSFPGRLAHHRTHIVGNVSVKDSTKRFCQSSASVEAYTRTETDRSWVQEHAVNLQGDSQQIDENSSRCRKLSPKRIRTEIVKCWLGMTHGTHGFY